MCLIGSPDPHKPRLQNRRALNKGGICILPQAIHGREQDGGDVAAELWRSHRSRSRSWRRRRRRRGMRDEEGGEHGVLDGADGLREAGTQVRENRAAPSPMRRKVFFSVVCFASLLRYYLLFCCR